MCSVFVFVAFMVSFGVLYPSSGIPPNGLSWMSFPLSVIVIGGGCGFVMSVGGSFVIVFVLQSVFVASYLSRLGSVFVAIHISPATSARLVALSPSLAIMRMLVGVMCRSSVSSGGVFDASCISFGTSSVPVIVVITAVLYAASIPPRIGRLLQRNGEYGAGPMSSSLMVLTVSSFIIASSPFAVRYTPVCSGVMSPGLGYVIEIGRAHV